MGETIFCRQVDSVTYADASEELMVDSTNTQIVDDHKTYEDTEQIRTLRQQPGVSADAPGTAGEEITMPKAKGSYILGYIQDIGCPICVDTGCTRTTISDRLYRRIPKERRPKLSPAPKMDQAVKGASVQPLGRAIFKLQLGTWTGKRLITVVSIADDALLGDDILRLDITGPGDILYTENVLKFAGHSIPLRTVGTCGDAPRVVCLQDEVIPGMSEKVVDAFLERPQGDCVKGEDSMIVEPNMEFCERYGCLVTPVLVDIRDRVTTCIRLLNPFPDPIKIPAEAVMGHLEPGTVKQVVQEKEYYGEDNNNLNCRRLTVESRSNTNKTNLQMGLTGAIGQPEPDRASDDSSLPNHGWLGQDGLRRLHLQKGSMGAVGQFTTLGPGDTKVSLSQRGELGQGRLSEQNSVVGQSGAESLACSVVGQSGAESLACSVVGQSGAESLACLVVGQSGAESLACSVVGQSGAESLTCSVVGQSGAESLTCSVVGQSGAESLTCVDVGQSGVESLTCSEVGQSGEESLACSAERTTGAADVLAGRSKRRDVRRVPVKAAHGAGARRV